MRPLSSKSSESIPDFPHVAEFSTLLASSFLHWTGTPLTNEVDVPYALYNAPFALVAHGTEPDPVFCYANLAAQKLWNMDWRAFTRLPSRLSAEPAVAAERERLLKQAAEMGFVDQYQGVRITSDGKRFRIHNTVLWNVVDSMGTMHGQAAVIREWEWL
jgi:hypothetical protein